MSVRDKAELLIADASDVAKLRKFAPDEMVTCDSCLRANAPTRTRCLYCGAALAHGQDTLMVQAEPASQVQSGSDVYYIVIYGGAEKPLADSVVTQLAERWQFQSSELQSALINSSPLPLLGASTKDQANQIVSELSEVGIQSLEVKDLDLKTDVESKKIQALEFADAGLTGIAKSPGERGFSAWDDLALIVTGRLRTHRVEAEERQRRAGTKALDRRELTTDESIIDIYSRSVAEFWRIYISDFDFSCLQERKRLTAFDNLKELIQLLQTRSQAEVADTYVTVRPLLARVWPLVITNAKNRSQRIRASRKDVSIVTATNNENQFNNYSRLLWFLKMRETETNR